MDPVTDASAAPSPAITPSEASAPTLRERITALSSEDRARYQASGELPEPQVTTPQADPSPAPLTQSADSSSDAEKGPESASGESTEQQPESDKSRARRQRNAERWDEMLEERGRLKAENDLLKKQIAAGTAPKTPDQDAPKPQPSTTKRPRLKDFSGDGAVEQWEEACDAFDAAERQREREELRKEFGDTLSQRETRTAAQKRLTEAKSKYPDFESVVFDPQTAPPASDLMISAIGSREDGFDIAYYLGKHPAESERIAKLTLDKSAKAEARVEFEYDAIAAKLKGSAAPDDKPQPTPARLPRPSSEVSIPAKATPVADPLLGATGARYRELKNAEELREIRARRA